MTAPIPSRQNKLAHFPARRSATAVMAGAFDPIPTRFVLTSVLNGVPVYQEVEGEDDRKRAEKRARKRAQRAERKLLAERKARERHLNTDSTHPEASTSFSHAAATNGSPSYWKARPAIHIPNLHQRSVSVSPPPSPHPDAAPFSSASTPSPSESSSVTRSSFKRLRTPDDDDELVGSSTPVGKAVKKRPPPKLKRPAVRKGWKGWVEAPEDEIPISDKLINLDNIQVFQDRKTRSGKHFDAWV